MSNALFNFLRIPAWLVLNIAFFPKVMNAQNLHFKHKCIVIANHTSNWDPILLGHLVCPVCLRYMAKEEMFKEGFQKKFFLALGVIPVRRGKNDLKAMKTALSALKKGQSLGIFPEGHRSETGEMLPFEIGAAVIALKTETPVLPVFLNCRRYRLFRRVKAAVGEMLDLKQITHGRTDSEAVGQATQFLFDKMTELKKRTEDV
jgi:1-acyl-sn-glycerol-3-phosphate acyltransferase